MLAMADKHESADENETSQITYRTLASRHVRLKAAAAVRRTTMQELLDELIDLHLGAAENQQPRIGREQRERYAALDALFERAARDPKNWELHARIVDEILKSVKKANK